MHQSEVEFDGDDFGAQEPYLNSKLTQVEPTIAQKFEKLDQNSEVEFDGGFDVDRFEAEKSNAKPKMAYWII
jgi:hypothetical protein